jgi:hypothetical protein
MTDLELLEAARFAIGNGKLMASFRAPIGQGTWFLLDNGSAFAIERRGDGWNLADVTDCL